jgi:peptide deformylase
LHNNATTQHKTKRHERVEVRYQDLAGAERAMSLTGWEAKLFQHEYDHLQGVLFLDRMRAADVERLRPELVALEEAYAAARAAGGGGGEEEEEEFERLPPPKRAASKGFGGFGSKG